MFKKFVIPSILLLFASLILFLSLKGLPGNPDPVALNSLQWKDKGPFELSPERGRFALTYSIVEDKSLYFSTPLARFVTPDLGYKDGHYVSLFAPSVSFLVAPGYMVGKALGSAQVGTVAVISIFALLNAILIYAIARRTEVGKAAASIAAAVFLFATPAFSYAGTLYQHHITVFLILLSIYLLLRSKSIWVLFDIALLYAFAVTVDYPNLFLMAPIAIYAIGRMFYTSSKKESIQLHFDTRGIITVVGAILPILFFAWFNYQSYGSPTQLSGTIEAVKTIDLNGKPIFSNDLEGKVTIDPNADPNNRALHFFNSRNLLNGFYILLLSPDRGILFFTPVILFAIYGAFFLYKKNPKLTSLFVGIALIDIVLYGMWGDPWGGWAFGSRYLIPSYAICALLIAQFLESQKKNALILIFFYFVFVYSIGVNTLGALTTNAMPPKIEAEQLSNLSGHIEKYTVARNWEMLTAGDGTKSFVYANWLQGKLYPVEYYAAIVFMLSTMAGISLIYLYPEGRNHNHS